MSSDDPPVLELITGLVKTLEALMEPDMRAVVLVERLLVLEPQTAAAVLDGLVTPSSPWPIGRKLALSALDNALRRDLIPYDRLKKIYEATVERDADTAASVLLTAHARQPSETEPQPVMPGGRALTLGERKALARRPNRAMLDRLAADGDFRVIRVLLTNPRLGEGDVLRIAARRPSCAEVLKEVASSSRWVTRPRIRKALLFNPDTPEPLAIRLMTLLPLQDLKELASAASLPDARALAARKLYAQRTGNAMRGAPDTECSCLGAESGMDGKE